MKIVCTIELNVPEETTAEDVQRFVRRVRLDAEWSYRSWSPKVSVQLPVGVEGDDGDDGDTCGH